MAATNVAAGDATAKETLVDYQTIATLVRDSVSLAPNDPTSGTRLAARAAELGISEAAAAHLRRLWTAQGWLLPAALQDDAAAALMWYAD